MIRLLISQDFLTQRSPEKCKTISDAESLRAEVVKHHEQMQKMFAISDFKDTDVVVEMGEGKKSVVVIDTKTVNAMEKLYMTVIIV